MKYLESRYISIFVAVNLLFSACSNNKDDVPSSRIDSTKKALIRINTDIEEQNQKANYSKIISDDKITNASDEQIEQLIFYNINPRFLVEGSHDGTINEKKVNATLNRFTVSQQYFYSTIVVERNIKAYGFKTTFEKFKMVRILSETAINGYKNFKLPIVAGIIEEALGFENKYNVSDNDYRRLDSIYLNQLQKSKIEKLRANYVRNNISQFKL